MHAILKWKLVCETDDQTFPNQPHRMKNVQFSEKNILILKAFFFFLMEICGNQQGHLSAPISASCYFPLSKYYSGEFLSGFALPSRACHPPAVPVG